ncbi:MAG: T9SS type A sorting domain-containing protein [Bacteroidota bacterium]
MERVLQTVGMVVIVGMFIFMLTDKVSNVRRTSYELLDSRPYLSDGNVFTKNRELGRENSMPLSGTFDLGFELISGSLPAFTDDLNGDLSDESVEIPDVGSTGASAIIPPFGLWGGGSKLAYLVNGLDAHGGDNFVLIEDSDNCLGLRTHHDLTAGTEVELCFWAAAWDPNQGLNTSVTARIAIEFYNTNTTRWLVYGHPTDESLINSYYSTTGNTYSSFTSGSGNHFISNTDLEVSTSTNNPSSLDWQQICLTYTPNSSDEILFITKMGGSNWALALDDITCVPTSALNISAIAFHVEAFPTFNRLSWYGTFHSAYAGWYVQRIGSDFSWENLGFIELEPSEQEVNQYFFLDPYPLESHQTYRLMQVDEVGDIRFSEVREVQRELPDSWAISPNPFEDHLAISGPQGRLKIIDAAGKLIYRTTLDEVYQTIPTDNWPQGRYLAVFNSPEYQEQAIYVLKK